MSNNEKYKNAKNWIQLRNQLIKVFRDRNVKEIILDRKDIDILVSSIEHLEQKIIIQQETIYETEMLHSTNDECLTLLASYVAIYEPRTFELFKEKFCNPYQVDILNECIFGEEKGLERPNDIKE